MSNFENFKCPNCDATLAFDAEKQKLSCAHCGGTFDVDSFNEGKDLKIENETWDENNNIVTYTCKSCGGVIMADKNTVSTSCPYCGNPMVLSGNVEGDLKPKRIIPFKYNKEQAKECYKKHLSGKKILPKAFMSDGIIDEIKGIYVPYWIFDGRADGKMWFNATRVRTWSDGSYHYTETSNYKLFRSCKLDFNNVPVDASSKIDDVLTQSIEPFDVNEQKDFNTNYLAGYLADKYDVEADKSKQIAEERMKNSITQSLACMPIGYASCIPTSSSVNITEGSQTYVMYPIWLLNIKWKNKTYTFAMNGQTGKFVGDLPSDNSKLARISILVFLGVTALVSLLQFIFLK